MELFTKVNGEEKLDMDLAYKFGQMVLDMKAIGKIIKHMEKVNFGMLMEMSLMVSGEMTKQTAMEFIHMLMVRNMRVIGKMIYSMDME